MTTALRAPMRVSVATEPSHALEWVTPDKAKAFLAQRDKQRPLREEKVRQIADDMRSGRWVFTGECFGFDVCNRFINGQHRAAAIAASGISLSISVWRGLPEAAMRVTDTGNPRTASDLLHLQGHVNGKNLASVATLIYRYEKGDLAAGRPPSKATLLDVVERHPTLTASVLLASRCSMLIPAIASLVHYCGSYASPERAERFLLDVQSGENMDSTNPVWHLRKALLERRRTVKKLTRQHLLALTIKTWNAYNRGEPMRILSWRSSGPMAEPFPDFNPRPSFAAEGPE